MNRAGYSRQNMKSLAGKKKSDPQHKAHSKESHYLKSKMRHGLTFLPGFAHTGYQTHTVVKNTMQSKNSGDLLSDSFQELIGHRSNLRRSQRILTKHNNCNATASDTDLTAGGQRKTKSIFKNINRQYSKRQKTHYHSNNNASESSDLSFDNHSGNKNAELEPTHCQTYTDNSSYKKKFCTKFLETIRVGFRQNAIEQTKKRIENEALKANAVLAGKVEKNDLNATADLEQDTRDADHLIPVPSNKWVYRTPRNKKIATPQIEGSNIQPALLFKNGPECILHELKSPKKTVKFSCKFDHHEESPIKNGYFRSMVKAKTTPTRRAAVPLQTNRQYINLYEEREGPIRSHKYQPQAKCSPYYDCHSKEDVLEENDLPHFRGRRIDTCITEHDITIVMGNGNDFEMQVSQRSAGTKTVHDNLLDFQVNLDGEKMFNFNSQTSVFN